MGEAPSRGRRRRGRQAVVCAFVLALSTSTIGCSWLGWGEAETAAQREATGPPTIYKWVDEHGIPHYTTDRDRIPESLRDRIQVRPRAPASPEIEEKEGSPAEEERSDTADDSGIHNTVDPKAWDESWASRNAPLRPPAGDAKGDAGTTAALSRLDAKISALEAELAAREEELLSLLAVQSARPEGAPAVPHDEAMLADDPKLRTLSSQLPALQRELRVLRARRKSLGAAQR